jgi:hypothetical protein
MAYDLDNSIRFETKEQSNNRRIIEALNRTPDERFQFFLSLIEEFSMFLPEKQRSKKENFTLIKGNDRIV